MEAREIGGVQVCSFKPQGAEASTRVDECYSCGGKGPYFGKLFGQS